MATWRELITEAMNDNQETWDDVVHCTLTKEQLDVQFDDGFGGVEGAPFTLWTKANVYFPICHDGAEWAGSAKRDPCDEATQHLGGG